MALDRGSQTPIYQQIQARIREMILSGAMPPGFRLPPERRLADILDVNRSTVLAAYRELKADGLVDAHVGRGTVVVAQRYAPAAPEVRAELPWRQLFRHDVAGQDPIVRDLLEAPERPDHVSFAAGLPAPELIPVRLLADALAAVLERAGADALQHCPTEGHPPLRESLAALMASRGVTCSAADVLVLSGSQQGIDLVARVLIEPGDVVVVEQPSFFGGLQAFRAAQARLVGVATDAEGMRPDALAAVLQRYRPKLIYTLPSFQNPSSALLPPERRMRLLELAYQYQVPILEDDPYSELAFSGRPPLSLKAFDRNGHVIYLSTFSKALCPGLRLGWLVAPPAMLHQLVLAKQTVDLHSNTPGQWLLDEYVRAGHWAPHVATVRAAYRRRRDVMEEALRGERLPGVTWETAAGGFYLWCRLPDGVPAGRLLRRAAEAGVSFLPGRPCFVDEPPAGHVRLNFTHPAESAIPTGVARFAAALRDVLQEPVRDDARTAGTRPIV